QSFVGEIEQRVPAFSAVKINGKRAYDLARKGVEVEMPMRKVKIYEIEILEYAWPVLKIRTKVSSGTYIRTLGEDIGEKLGTGAYLTNLRRTKIDKYSVEDAAPLEDFMKS
ncbi:tRNA pseudouridine(55) synthase, partial [Candidatus Saccharibacteria bacterium]|nr:tRNA pseudouridine(55) synthase [Candidatus Saccharibacteria bacterium]